MNRDMTWGAQDNMMSQSIDFYCFTGYNPRYYITTEFTQNTHEEGTMVADPTLRLSMSEAQQIMNELWRVGVRPKNGAGAVAHTEAIQGHLADMRKIAFNRLKIAP